VIPSPAPAAGVAPPGTVVLLSGPTCSGKTTLARALQALLPRPYLHVGLDHFEAMQPSVDGRRVNLFYGQQRHPREDPASWGADLVGVMHGCVRSFARAGTGVVVEHIFLKRRWLKDVVDQLAGLPVLFVGVTCPVEVLEERERARQCTVARPGQAARQHRMLAALDAEAPYDVTVDTHASTIHDAALAVLSRLHAGPPFSFESLRGSPLLDTPDADVDTPAACTPPGDATGALAS
jgi:chloramphenicol 3-O phosphotransferase